MKKLDLNEAGAKVLAWGSILAIPIPAVLLLVSRFCGDKTRSILSQAARFSAAAGLAAIAILLGLVVIELRQDARLIARYEAERSIRVRLASGGYECQYCGSRIDGPDGRRCRVCGASPTPLNSGPAVVKSGNRRQNGAQEKEGSR